MATQVWPVAALLQPVGQQPKWVPMKKCEPPVPETDLLGWYTAPQKPTWGSGSCHSIHGGAAATAHSTMERQQPQPQTPPAPRPKQQQQPVLHAVTLGDAGRAGLKKQEGAEGHALAGGEQGGRFRTPSLLRGRLRSQFRGRLAAPIFPHPRAASSQMVSPASPGLVAQQCWRAR